MNVLVALGVLVFASVFFVANASNSVNNPFFCYTTDPIRSMTNMHSTFTSYEAVRRFNFTTVNPYVSTCTPSRFWYLGRYGTRFPHPAGFQNMLNFANSTIQQTIVSNYQAGRSTLCRQDYEAIRDWTVPENFVITNAGLLTETGVVQLQNIARRFQANFPDILTETYSPDRFHFRHTNTERTSSSIRAFASGLFGDEASQDVVYEEVPEFDWFLRPFDFCGAFNAEVADWALQRDAFQAGPEFELMMREVNNKLGFTTNRLGLNEVFVMWDWCRHETGSTFELSGSETGPDSPWCAPFSVAHHLTLEYLEDLGHFYFSGYGLRNQRLLENLNCGLAQDLLNHVRSEDDSDPAARIFLSYTQEVQGLLVVLGTFRDTWPLHQHNFAQQTARHWLTSLIGVHGSNLSVIRFDCEDGDHDLVFLINERPILVPGCDTRTGICKLSTIVDRLERFLDVDCQAFFCTSD